MKTKRKWTTKTKSVDIKYNTSSEISSITRIHSDEVSVKSIFSGIDEKKAIKATRIFKDYTVDLVKQEKDEIDVTVHDLIKGVYNFHNEFDLHVISITEKTDNYKEEPKFIELEYLKFKNRTQNDE